MTHSFVLVIVIIGMMSSSKFVSSQSDSKYNTHVKVILNGLFGIGTFAAEENPGSSDFLGGPLAPDWKSNLVSGWAT